jgi:hypothetical protein
MADTINRRWFETQLANRKLSQRRFAALIEIDPSAMSLMLSGKRKMSAIEAGEVAKHLGVPVDEVLRHAGVSVPTDTEKNVPVVGVVGDRLEVKMGRVPGPVSVPAPADAKGYKNCRALRVQADGPMNGWLLLYRPTDGVSLEAVGRLCVVRKVGDDRLYVRWVNRGYDAGWFNLSSLGMGESEHTMLDSASPVLWIKQ